MAIAKETVTKEGGSDEGDSHQQCFPLLANQYKPNFSETTQITVFANDE
jgi:hypothetical protein